jgi:hypothetical protein
MKKNTLTWMAFIFFFLTFNQINAQDCSKNILYINPTLITNSGITIQEWILQNPKMVLCKNEIDEIIVDFEKFNDENDIPKWLKDNSGYIDYTKSNRIIEAIHSLESDSEYVREADKELIINRNFYSITYDFLKLYINDQDIDSMHPRDYYKNYKNVYKNLFNKIKIKNTNGFILGKHNFSAPFLRSIIANRNIDKSEYKNCFFQFTIVKINSKEVAVLKFTYKGDSFYYNFSDEPGSAAITKMDKNRMMTKKAL